MRLRQVDHEFEANPGNEMGSGPTEVRYIVNPSPISNNDGDDNVLS